MESGKTVTQGTLALGNATGQASNYTLTGGTLTLSVTPRTFSVTASRGYNATSVAQEVTLATEH